MTAANPFAGRDTADLYARDRPDHHPRTTQRLQRLLGEPVDAALDVACGTGGSTAALRRVARTVVGTDVAPAMVAVAAATHGGAFVAAAAERLPFPDASFGLVSVASAVHWFDQERFFAQLAPFFAGDDDRRTLRFWGSAACYRPVSP